MPKKSVLSFYPYAVAGDLVFVSNTVKGLPIEAYQRMRQFPHPEKVHVAVVVSPVDMMEAMIRKEAYSVPFPQWRKSRKLNDVFHVLRHPDAKVENTGELVDAALYYLEESYAFGDVIRDTIKDTPSKLGYSICSGLAVKILNRSGVLDVDELAVTGQVYPGPLYSMLSDLGWYSVQVDDTYFNNRVIDASGSLMNIRISSKISSDRAHEMGEVAAEITNYMTGVLESVPAKDALHVFSESSETTALEFIAEKIVNIVYDQARALHQLNSGEKNWKDKAGHNERIEKIVQQAEIEKDIVFKFLNALQEAVRGSLDAERWIEQSIGIRAEFIHSGVASEVRIRALVDMYVKAESEFLRATGFQAAEFSNARFTFNFDHLYIYREADEELLGEIIDALTKYFESVQKLVAHTALQIGRCREVLESVVNQEALNMIDKIVSSSRKLSQN